MWALVNFAFVSRSFLKQDIHKFGYAATHAQRDTYFLTCIYTYYTWRAPLSPGHYTSDAGSGNLANMDTFVLTYTVVMRVLRASWEAWDNPERPPRQEHSYWVTLETVRGRWDLEACLPASEISGHYLGQNSTQGSQELSIYDNRGKGQICPSQAMLTVKVTLLYLCLLHQISWEAPPQCLGGKLVSCLLKLEFSESQGVLGIRGKI